MKPQSAMFIAFAIYKGEIGWPEDVEVDPLLKDLVCQMLNPLLEERLGGIMPYVEDLYIENEEIYQHPFMKGVQWKLMEEKRVLVS